MMTDEDATLPERWLPNETAWFEYHCWESPESGDAEIWYRSHQQVTILSGPTFDGKPADDRWTRAMRDEAGDPNCYEVRFVDGLEWTVFEDELLPSPRWFERDAPPPMPAMETVR